MKRLVFLSLLTSSVLHAQDGKQLYTTYCSACHAPDGKGASNGMFPPLADSEWVQGKPDRMIQVVLQGLQGPIKVSGKDYNLVMPPQGAALTDDQIAKIVTYVRSDWGNKESAVTPSHIKAQREASKDQVIMWKATDLLKKYPLPVVEVPVIPTAKIHDLLSYTHHGQFKSLAQLRATKPKNGEEEKDGLLSLTHADRKNYFGLVWEGWLDVPKDGKYTFFYNTDDGGALTLNGGELITRDRVGGFAQPSKASINLKKGRNDIKVEFFEFNGGEEISLHWQGPGLKKTPLYRAKPAKPKAPPIMLSPPESEALIYRNFIKGTDPRAIGVGYPGGVNLSFSADTMALDLLWTGQFMDAGHHWTNRGMGSVPPAGDKLVTVNRGIPFAMLESGTSKWKPTPALAPRFRGYRLDAKQHPTFMYEFGKLSFVDEILPEPEGRGFNRKIEITIPSEAANEQTLYFRALSGLEVSSQNEREFHFGKQMIVSVPQSSGNPIPRSKELLIPIPLNQGNQTITLNYRWK